MKSPPSPISALLSGRQSTGKFLVASNKKVRPDSTIMKRLFALSLLGLVAACDKKPVSAPPPPGTDKSPAKTVETAPPAPAVTESSLGLKFFPEARVVTSGETAELVSANLQVAKPSAEVVKFYENELGLPESGKSSGTFKGEKHGKVTVVSINSDASGTNVSIMRKK